MSAQPIPEPDPDDPVEILHILPQKYHDQFLAEYKAAVDNARRPEQYRRLQSMLRLWRLRSIAYSAPGYKDRLTAGRDGTSDDVAPAEQFIPDWPVR